MILAWALRTSKHLDATFGLRAKFLIAALRQREVSKQLAHADPRSPMGELMAEWPQTAGALLWPYQCSAWQPTERVRRIAGHLDVVAQIPGLKLAPDDKLVLADLSSFSPDTWLILDRAPWLAREGHLTLSLFKGEFRAFTVSFSLLGYPDTELFIGGLQGRQSDGILSLYREMTKDFEGMRPRDLVLEILRLFAVKLSIRHIYAVADDQKISRHEYFGEKGATGLFYDDVWRDRGGQRIDQTRFELPLDGSRRALEEVSAKKRSMYRRRYEMLDKIEAGLPSDLITAERRQFSAR